MQVETRYVQVGDTGDADFDSARAVARTIIRLDGDSEGIIPMRLAEGGSIEVDTLLFELHQNNVETAIEYRSKILNSLLTMLQR